jgi:hypothetical protein
MSTTRTFFRVAQRNAAAATPRRAQSVYKHVNATAHKSNMRIENKTGMKNIHLAFPFN